MAQVSALVDTLKSSLKAAGIKYTQVATALQLSESSIKRKFSRREFSIAELDSICALAGMQISDLVRRMDEKAGRLQALSAEQEQEIADDTGLLLVAVSVLNRWTFDQLLQFYSFSDTELIQMLVRLDRLKMIELLPNNRIKLLVAPNFGWLPNGPIEQVFLKAIQQDFFSTRFDRDDHKLIVLNGMLSPNSNREFQRRLERLAREFDLLNAEDAGLPLGEKHGCTVLLALRDWHYRTFSPFRRRGRAEMIRSSTAADAGAIADLYNVYVRDTVTTFETEPVSAADMGQRIAAVQQLGLPWLTLEQEGAVCGYACAVRWKTRAAYRRSVESTVYLAADAGGRGLGLRLYSRLMAELRQRQVHCVLAGIALPNAASVALHEKLGFEKVAHLREVGHKFGHWIDVGYWQLLFDADPDPSGDTHA